MQPIFPISGRPGFRRVGAIRRARAIDEPWQDGDGVRSDDDAEELGGVAPHISAEILSRIQALQRRVQQHETVLAEAAGAPEAGSDRLPFALPRALPGARQFRGGNALDAFLVYGDAESAWLRLRYSGSLQGL